MIDPSIKAKDRIYAELPEELKKLMERYILSEEEHERILEDIKKTSYVGKTPVERPKYIIVVGQTGSGKSNLTSLIYEKDSNIVIIDTDKYKAYRADNEEILREHLSEYAFLTAPDAFLHRDEMIEDAMRLRYNILMECATSEKDGLFVSIPKIQEAGYTVELNVLGVSSLNSAISVHERYEALMELKNNSAKLTGLSRHDDSFNSLISTIKNEQMRKGVKINVYKRGDRGGCIKPQIVYNSQDDFNKFASPIEAIIYAQNQDLNKTLVTASDRCENIKKQMQKRQAPKTQLEQLEEVKRRYETIIERGNIR